MLVFLLVAAALGCLLYRCTATSGTRRTTKGDGLSDSWSERDPRPTSKNIPEAGRTLSGEIDRKLRQNLALIKELAPTEQKGERARSLLRATEHYLMRIPQREAAAAILRQLETRADAQTEMVFATGEDGLTAWPTWRVYLLDLLGSINPKAAADYARNNIFVRYGSADEWAVAMRSVLAAAPSSRQAEARSEIASLLGRMLANSVWREQPGAGMLEALDYVPQTPDAIPHLRQVQQWAAEKNDPVINAAMQLALERAITRQGDRVMTALASDPDLLADSPAQKILRASAMARADLRQSAQVVALRGYLARLPAGSDEVEAFFSSFPNHRYGVSPGLGGQPALPTSAEMRSADQAALAQIRVWKSDPAVTGHAVSFSALEIKLRRMLGP